VIHRFAAASGSRIHVEDIGWGTTAVKTPIVAVHGLAGGAYFFSGLAKRVQDECRVVSIDLPGTGRSRAGDTGYSMETWVADLGQLVAEHVKQPIVLLGHSMGTIIGLKAWAAWPELIRGLIFVGGLPVVRPLIRERLSNRIAALAGAQDLVGWGPQVSPGVFSPQTIHHRPEVVTAFERLFEINSVDTYVRCVNILLGGNADEIVPTVQRPSLAITGEHDQYAPADAVTAFVERIPATHRVEVLRACGHVPFFEVPDTFAAAVRAFVRTC
jgi:pimeloyl-ACP methyl ester carboxylesterase